MLEPIGFPQRAVPPTPPSQKEGLKTKILDLSSAQIIQIIQETGLVEQKWFPYHAKAVRKLGPTKYLEISDAAKLGSDPRTLFSWMIKEEMQ